jgi:acyl carrier protein
MDELFSILKEIKPDVDFSKEDNLIEKKLLDSFDIVRLVSRLSEEFDISITPLDIIPENFKSVQTIYDMIQRLSD